MIRAWFITTVMTWRVHMHEHPRPPTPLRRCSRLRLSPTPPSQHFVTPPWQFTTTHLYPWVASGIEKIKCLVQEHNTIFSRAQAQAYVCTRYYPVAAWLFWLSKIFFATNSMFICCSSNKENPFWRLERWEQLHRAFWETKTPSQFWRKRQLL